MVTVEELMIENKWEEEEEPTVKRYLNAVTEIIKNAGAFKESSDILPLVISSMVATMMEQRGQGNDFVNVSMFPLSIQALVNSIKYSGDEDD